MHRPANPDEKLQGSTLGVRSGATGIEFDKEAQEGLDYEFGSRELYPYAGMHVAEVLKEHGVTLAFGIFGGHIWNFVDPISRIGIKNITFLHEQNAVYCGEAYAQVSGKPAVCYTTVGPGVGNAVTAIQQAYLSNSPIIFLCGGHEIEHDKLYNTIQESYATELCSSISKWAQRLVYPHQVKQFMTRAFKEAQTFPQGPVVMELGISCLLTQDSVKEKVWWGLWGDHASWIPSWRGAENMGKPMVSGGNPDDIAAAVKRLYEVERPYMILGDGPNWAGASEELTELVTLAKIPFTTRRTGRAVVSENHEFYFRGLPRFRDEIQVMVPVGLKVGFFDGYGVDWPETIQISESTSQIWTYLPTSATVIGNPKVVARQMIDYIKANNLQPPPGRDAWIEKIQKAKAESEKRRRDKAMYYGFEHPKYKTERCMHYGYLSQATADYLEEKYQSRVRIMIDGYTMSDFCMPYLKATRPAQILSSSEQAGVGHGVPMAMGAAFAQLEQGDRTPVLALMGDSGMTNAGMEIDTAARYKLPIVYLVTENNGWIAGMKYHWYGPNWENLGEQDRGGAVWHGIKQEFGGLAGEREPRLRFDHLARDLNCYGEYCDRHEDFLAALHRCFQEAEKGIPAVLHCKMDTDLINSNMTGPVYCLMFAHLPWCDLPERAKRARKSIWGKTGKFPGLLEVEDMTHHDAWEPLSEEEKKLK
ncbi:MAG: thiamine pyrophosphate-binding protein [Deltaproteobacteria bacterium]|nr:thiamine pyrophosphate-binding protein [Deltaproteobacteria bacterium]